MNSSACNGVAISKGLHSGLAKSLVLLGLCLWLSGCAALLFHPMKKLVATPADAGVAYEDVWLADGDPRLHGWWLPAQGEARATVYFLHGNAENISTHMHSVLWLPEQGYNVFLLDYRGYGRSEGAPELPGVIEDVRRGYHWLRARGELPVVVLGQSIGGAVAGYAMATEADKPDALVLDAAVASFPRIAREVAQRQWLTWPFAGLAAALMPSDYDLDAVIGQLAGVPQLYLHSPDDGVIPPGHTQTLYALAAEPKQRHSTHGPHIATFAFPAYRDVLLDFMDTLAVQAK